MSWKCCDVISNTRLPLAKGSQQSTSCIPNFFLNVTVALIEKDILNLLIKTFCLWIKRFLKQNGLIQEVLNQEILNKDDLSQEDLEERILNKKF